MLNVPAVAAIAAVTLLTELPDSRADWKSSSAAWDAPLAFNP